MTLTSWEKLVNKLHCLPSVSKKNAEQIAYYLLKQNQKAISDLLETIALVEKTIKLCQNCANISEQDICVICQDSNREKILIVVESPLDIFKFEKIDHLKTYYHVLGGLIGANHEIDHLNLALLQKRSHQFKEIILALSPTLNGIVTFNYLKDILVNQKVSQLAQGVPIGANLSYVDPLTLKLAIDNRKDIK